MALFPSNSTSASNDGLRKSAFAALEKNEDVIKVAEVVIKKNQAQVEAYQRVLEDYQKLILQYEQKLEQVQSIQSESITQVVDSNDPEQMQLTMSQILQNLSQIQEEMDDIKASQKIAHVNREGNLKMILHDCKENNDVLQKEIVLLQKQFETLNKSEGARKKEFTDKDIMKIQSVVSDKTKGLQIAFGISLAFHVFEVVGILIAVLFLYFK